jgi:hypothetical protein
MSGGETFNDMEVSYMATIVKQKIDAPKLTNLKELKEIH